MQISFKVSHFIFSNFVKHSYSYFTFSNFVKHSHSHSAIINYHKHFVHICQLLTLYFSFQISSHFIMPQFQGWYKLGKHVQNVYLTPKTFQNVLERFPTPQNVSGTQGENQLTLHPYFTMKLGYFIRFSFEPPETYLRDPIVHH